MRFSNGLRRAALALLAVVSIAALVACGSDSKEDDASAAGSAASTSAKAGSKKLSDCEYASAFVETLDKFTTSLGTASTAAVGNKDQALKSFDSLDAELSALISELKSYQLSSDVAKVNSSMIAIFEDLRKQVPELRSAASYGNTAKLVEVSGTFGREMAPRLQKIEQDNKGAVEKLNTCEG